MAGAKEIRNKIGSVKNTQKITSAMEMVAASKMRRAIYERAGSAQEGSIDVAFARLQKAGITPDTIAHTLAKAYVAPVLTAHPTEVQRQSILQAERDIARLLAERDDISARAQLFAGDKDALTPRQLAANEAQLRARVEQLWQTRLLRHSKLTVADEIENALSYYETTFLHELPKLYASLEEALPGQQVHSFMRMGQWIGGDRDGNPNVTAPTLELALRRQSEVALRHYLQQQVSCRMTVGIVHCLEAIQIDVEQGTHRIVSLCLAQGLVQSLSEQGAIRQRGEAVVIRLPPDGFFLCLMLADIFHQQNEVRDLATIAADG